MYTTNSTPRVRFSHLTINSGQSFNNVHEFIRWLVPDGCFDFINHIQDMSGDYEEFLRRALFHSDGRAATYIGQLELQCDNYPDAATESVIKMLDHLQTTEIAGYACKRITQQQVFTHYIRLYVVANWVGYMVVRFDTIGFFPGEVHRRTQTDLHVIKLLPVL